MYQKEKNKDNQKKAEQSLISVIVPVYNVEAYLDECLESIVQQTYTNLEIILVDDGSTDESGTMCDAWTARDSRVTVIHKENGGLSSARNSGLQVAHGEYISYVDSDDYIDTSMLHTLIELLTDNEAQAAGCQYLEVGGNRKQDYVATEQSYTYSGRHVCNKMIEQIPTAPRITFSVWKVIYKASAVKDISFEEGVYYEDAIYSFRALWNLDKVVFYDKPLYFYRIRSGSITQVSVNSKHARDAIHFITWQYDFYQEQGNLEEQALEKSNALQQLLDYRFSCPSNLKEERKIFSQLIKKYNLGYKDLQNHSMKSWLRYIVFRYFYRAWRWIRVKQGVLK